MSDENHSLMDIRSDPTSSLWKKKYTLLLKRSENVEKQNMRLINRLYQIKKITNRLTKEKKFLMKRLDGYNDNFRTTKFYIDSELLPEGSSENFVKSRGKKKYPNIPSDAEVSSYKKSLGIPPKKPMSAFFRYCQAQHLQILKENSGMPHDEIKRSLAEKWNAMTESQKEVYYEPFEEERDNYEKDMNQFLSNFKDNAETSGITYIYTEEQEEQEEEEETLVKEEEEESNDVTPKEGEETPERDQNSDDEKIDDAGQDVGHLDEASLNSSLSDQGSISSDEQMDENG